MLPWDHRRLIGWMVFVRYAVWGVREGWVALVERGLVVALSPTIGRDLFPVFCALFRDQELGAAVEPVELLEKGPSMQSSIGNS